jgi:hypothetical protein
MVQLLPLLEAVRDHPLPRTQRQDERRIKNEEFPESQERAVSHVAIDRWAIVVRGLRHDPQQGRESGPAPLHLHRVSGNYPGESAWKFPVAGAI